MGEMSSLPAFVQDRLQSQDRNSRLRRAGALPSSGPKVHKPPRRSSPRRVLTKHEQQLPRRTPTEPTEAQPMPTTQPAPAVRNERRMVFTSSQAALYLGVSLATIRRWTDAGHIDCYRTPGGQR